MVASRLTRGLLAMLLVAITVMALSNSVQAGASGCTLRRGILGKRVPILLVHGWASNGNMWGKNGDLASMLHALNELPNVYVDDPPFDYSKYDQEWVDSPNIGPALAQRIVCLAQASSIGKVIAIGHSMGGLAIRYAATKSTEASEVTRDLGLVITIATPNLGSGLANAASGVLRDFLCHVHATGNYRSENNLCVLSAISSLRDNSQELKDLPWLPNSIPALAIAGDITITYPLLFMAVKLNIQTDLIVSMKSALQGMAHPEAGGGQSTFSCSVSIRELDLVARLILQQTVLPPCWHSGLPHNRAVEKATVNAIKKYLSSIGFASYVGSWHVHGANLTINADWTGLERWNVGPCTQSLSDTSMCNGNAKITFTLNTDGSIKGTIQSVWYTQWGGEPYSGTPVGAGYIQPSYSFSLKHVGSHLLSETWLNNPEGQGNSWWCDASYAGYECGQ